MIGEDIQLDNSDTTISYVYYPTGKIQRSHTYVDGKLNGNSFSYFENGNVIYQEYYVENKKHGKFISYYYSGSKQLIQYFDQDFYSDTSIYFDTNEIIVKKLVHTSICEWSNNSCNKIALIYSNGELVYSYSVIAGFETDNHIIYNQLVYDSLMLANRNIPLYEKGELLFKQNCAACHKLDRKLVGPALNCTSENITSQEFSLVVLGSNKHPSSRLTSEQIDSLLEYIKVNCKTK